MSIIKHNVENLIYPYYFKCAEYLSQFQRKPKIYVLAEANYETLQVKTMSRNMRFPTMRYFEMC